MACHKANNLGVDVAPPLVTVKTKGREGIFTAILDPNKEVAPQYIAYTVNTKDGQTLAGIITNDNANSMTLKMMGGAEVNIPRSNIKGSSAAGAQPHARRHRSRHDRAGHGRPARFHRVAQMKPVAADVRRLELLVKKLAKAKKPCERTNR